VEEFEQKALVVAKTYISVLQEYSKVLDLEEHADFKDASRYEFKFGEGHVEIKYSYRVPCRCGRCDPYESGLFTFPSDYLRNENWEEELRSNFAESVRKKNKLKLENDRKELYTRFSTVKSAFDTRFHEAAKLYAEATGQYFNTDYESFEITQEQIQVGGQQPCSRGCCSDYWSLSIPNWAFWDEEVVERVKNEQQKKTAEALERKAAEQARQAVETERRRRASYEELKKEYGAHERHGVGEVL
jgi:hypothetical protein